MKKKFQFPLPLFLLLCALFFAEVAGIRPFEAAAEPILNEASPPPGEEYPVAYWAQTHIHQALLLHRKITPDVLQSACRTGILTSGPTLQAAWKSFQNPIRRTFCQKYPAQTLHLLGEAPYFMLRPPGSHK